MVFVGIDYGSKLAGTTVIAYQDQGKVRLVRSVKKQDADQMILEFMLTHKPQIVGLDAPLSLPGVYQGLEGYNDYHYRACDKELKAMSPMFLGGLTARAMKLKHGLEAYGIEVYEVYPVITGATLFPEAMGYRTKAPNYPAMTSILAESGIQLANSTTITTSHDLDGILALKTAQMIGTDHANSCGEPQEGVIYY